MEIFFLFYLFCCLLDFQTSAAVSLCFCLSPFSVKATTASCTTTVIEFIVLIKLQTLELQYMLLRFVCRFELQVYTLSKERERWEMINSMFCS